MSTNSDLASWGEPPATPAEEALGTLLDKVLAKIESGKAVKLKSRRGDRPELLQRGQELVRTVDLLYECAASVWENSVMQPNDDPKGSPRFSTIGLPSFHGEKPEVPKKPVSPAPAMGALPDPFPGQFRILRVLGEGAFGKVLLADDLALGRQVALKTLKLPATSTLGPHVLAALRKEAQHLAQLDHPNIVRVHAWLEALGDYYLVLQYVAGGSLGDRLKTEKVLSWQEATRYAADVGEALVAAHKCGVIHRDVKPDNILRDAIKDEAVLTDLGVSARLAEPGTVAGTPMYMAPEAFEGHISPALDVYGLAGTLFHLLTGKLPFGKASVHSLVNQKLQGLPDPDPRCKAIPEALERIIRAGLAGKPEDRPGMADFVATLRGSLNQLLADALVTPNVKASGKVPVNLRLVVSRRVQGDTYEPVGTTKPASGGLTRDMKKVPRSPEQVSVRTGDRVRIEVVADKTGYVTVFNIGPTGNLNLLYPDDPTAIPPPVEANRPLHVVDVEMTPPVGRERVFVLWSKRLSPLGPGELVNIAEGGVREVTQSYKSSRDMKRLRESVNHLGRDDCHVTIVEVNHHT